MTLNQNFDETLLSQVGFIETPQTETSIDKNMMTHNSKTARPKKPINDPKYPTKIELALILLYKFKTHFPNITI